MTSPPKPMRFACLPLMTPCDVDTMTSPSPPMHFGISLFGEYSRSPGLLMRCRPLMTRSRFVPYLSVIRMTSRGMAATSSKSLMKPSALRTFAISFFSRDAGMSTRSWNAVLALRMRVSMSATGSVVSMCLPLTYVSPRRLRDAGDLAHVRALAEADAAQAELAQVTARAAAQLAAVVLTHFELRLELGLLDQTRLRHQAAAPSRRR